MTHQGYTGIPASMGNQLNLYYGYQPMTPAVLQGGESVRARAQTVYMHACIVWKVM